MRFRKVHAVMLVVGVVCVSVVGLGLAVVTYRWVIPHPAPTTAPATTPVSSRSVGVSPPQPTVTRRAATPTPLTTPPTTTAGDAELMGALARDITVNCGGLEHVAAAAWSDNQWALVCQQPNGYRLAATIGDRYTTTAVTPAAESQRCTFHTQLGYTPLVLTPDTLRVGDHLMVFAHGVCRAGS